MPWIIPVATIAASLLTKDKERRRAEKAALRDTQQGILETRASQLGAQPYGRQVNQLGNQMNDINQHFNSQENGLGMALQAYSAASGAGKPTTPIAGGAADAASAPIAGGAPMPQSNPLADVDGAMAGFDEYQRSKQDPNDPWDF